MADEGAAAVGESVEAPENKASQEVPSHTYEELHGMTVAALREVASGLDHPAVQGYSQLNKEHLLPKVCEALGVEAHEHHEVVGINKRPLKAQIRQLKADRLAAIDLKDGMKLKSIRREIRALKRKMRKAMV